VNSRLRAALFALCLAGAPGAAQETQEFTCPMHLEVRADKPGVCPRCSMALVPAAPAVPRDFDLDVEATPHAIKPASRSACASRSRTPSMENASGTSAYFTTSCFTCSW
jgi:hypothetical protein